jgi:hypothetical protein
MEDDLILKKMKKTSIFSSSNGRIPQYSVDGRQPPRLAGNQTNTTTKYILSQFKKKLP